MSRVADADLEALGVFLEEYRIASDLGAQARGALLKRFHRHVLAALQIWEGLSGLAASGSASVNSVALLSATDAFGCVGEYFSDLVCVLGCAINGLYKPANTQLRSAVENIVRGLASLTSLEAGETKSVYRLFELASAQKPFQGDSSADLSLLKQIYGELCLHVHSATPTQRAGIHHLAAHMRHDTGKLKSLVSVTERTNRAVLSILVRADKKLYVSSSPKVQDLLDEILPKEVRLRALGG